MFLALCPASGSLVIWVEGGSASVGRRTFGVGARPILASMTRHSRATQCLGSADAKAWWMAVADPALRPEELDFTSVNLVEVQPGEGVKLHQGTWHAGPYFLSSSALFFNLELSDTNLTDHNFHHLSVPIKLKLELS